MEKDFSVEIQEYEFDDSVLQETKDIQFVEGNWPLVYIIHDENSKVAYIGETTDALARMSAHLRHKKKKVLKRIKLIMSDRFNKSAALDIESSLIRYMAGDGTYTLLNGNVGIANHTYYQQKQLYHEIFKSVWAELQKEGMVQSSLGTISNSDLFKYSPYKSLTKDQKKGLIEIIQAVLHNSAATVMVEGGAGTGKSILAIYFFKLLYTDPDELDFRDFGEDEFEFIRLIQALQIKYPNPKVGLVIPMTSFRTTLKNVFKNIHGLRSSMVIGPAEVTKERYDIILVDESHRLRRRVNLGAYFVAFDKANEKMGLSKYEATELDWVLKQSDKQVLFYDKNQSIKPSDVEVAAFTALLDQPKTKKITLRSQLRSLGGNDYVSYIESLLRGTLDETDGVFNTSTYDFKLFDSLSDMIETVTQKNDEVGLSRLVAGYAWKWDSQNNPDPEVFDMEIEGIQLRWNATNTDWINSKNAVNEVGCIHTTQGYDLNYVGVIFGPEISYDVESEKIVIKPENYHDKNGKQSVKSEEELQEFVLNIYKTMMLRGIQGTYVYVCDPNLRAYFRKFIPTDNKIDEVADTPKKMIISPYTKDKLTAVPLFDSVGCGDMVYADPTSTETVDVPHWLIKPGAKYFALRTTGDSMNELDIHEGDIILCQKNYQAPSGSNAIVLVGEDAVFKQIRYEKDGLVLIPKSDNNRHQIRKLTEGDEFKVLGVFVCKIS